MLVSLFNRAEKCIAKKVIFLDFDDTVAIPARKFNGEYDVKSDGSIDATHLDKEKFRKLVQVAIQHSIPLYFVTGRPNIHSCKKLLNDFIQSVDGFNEGLGGFKKDSIYFISQMIQEGDQLVRKELATKLEIITKIHQSKYSYLNKEDILFVDDMETYLEPVKELGYQTVQAQIDLSHFFEGEKFMISQDFKILNKPNH